MELDELLKKLLHHKVTLTYTPHEESQLRETDGVLVFFDTNVIHLKTWSSFGGEESYYMNRHGCTLHSIIDYGLKEASR